MALMNTMDSYLRMDEQRFGDNGDAALEALAERRRNRASLPTHRDREVHEMTEPKHEDLVQTHEDIEEIPEGVEVSNSLGSETPDKGEPEPEDYSDVDIEEDTKEEEDI